MDWSLEEVWIALGGAGIALVLLLEWGRGRLWGDGPTDEESSGGPGE